MISKAARFAEFLKQLDESSPASSAEEALEILAATLNGVENEFTSIPFEPDKWLNDGRMYPPQPDSARSVPGHRDITRYRSVGHNTWIAANGAIRIAEAATGAVVLDKPGADGCRVDLP
jgi:hypothetical protein